MGISIDFYIEEYISNSLDIFNKEEIKGSTMDQLCNKLRQMTKDDMKISSSGKESKNYLRKIGPDITKKIFTEYLGPITCEKLTDNGKNCYRSLIYKDDKGNTKDCTGYCKDNCKQWIETMLKNIPKTVQLINTKTNEKYEIKEPYIDINIYGKEQNFFNSNYLNLGTDYHHKSVLIQGKKERFFPFPYRRSFDVKKIGDLICDFLLEESSTLIIKLSCKTQLYIPDIKLDEYEDKYEDIYEDESEYKFDMYTKEFSKLCPFKIVSFDNDPTKRMFRGYNEWKIESGIYSDNTYEIILKQTTQFP